MVSENYIKLRQQVLDYTNKDMNLTLDNDKQVYIAVFDIPVESIILNRESQTLALVFWDKYSFVFWRWRCFN